MRGKPASDSSAFWGVQPHSRPSSADDEVTETQRRRLFYGLSHAVARKGYAAASVADVLAEVRISRRTFYQLFHDKEDCFLKAYELAHQALVAHINKTREREKDPLAQMLSTCAAHLHFIAAEPVLSQAFLVGIRSAGPRALKRRAEAHEEFAVMHRGLHEGFRAEQPLLPRLPDELFLGVVGGVNKMVTAEIEAGRAAHVERLLPTILYYCFSLYGLPELANQALREGGIKRLHR